MRPRGKVLEIYIRPAVNTKLRYDSSSDNEKTYSVHVRRDCREYYSDPPIENYSPLRDYEVTDIVSDLLEQVTWEPAQYNDQTSGSIGSEPAPNVARQSTVLPPPTDPTDNATNKDEEIPF